MRMETRKLAVFDFDGTMIEGDSIVAFVRMAGRHGLLTRFQLTALGARAIPYALGITTAIQYKEKALAFFYRLPPEDRQRMSEDFVRDELLPRVYPAALERLQAHRKEGCLCLLVSASTDNYIPLVGKALGFDGVVCSHLNDAGQVTFNCKGGNKLVGLRQYFVQHEVEPDWARSYAYGDSASDLPVLQKCGRGVLIDPKRKLRRAAPGMPRESWRASV